LSIVRGFLLIIPAGLLLTAAQDATFFSGSVLACSPTEITVSRRALISNATTQIFLIDSETKIEGKLRVKANVTVRYLAVYEGNPKALGIIVR
jgi:hypothetical protein